MAAKQMHIRFRRTLLGRVGSLFVSENTAKYRGELRAIYVLAERIPLPGGRIPGGT